MPHLPVALPTLDLDYDTLHLLFDYLPLRPYLIRASHVSRSWRAAALCHRSYWQRVYLTELSEARVFGLECQLQASSNVIEELHIVVDCPSRDGDSTIDIDIALESFSARLTSVISSNIHRIRRFFIDAKQAPDHGLIRGILDHVSERAAQLPLLEYLYLRSAKNVEDCPVLRGSKLDAPNLISLSLENMVLLEYDHYPRLCSLALGDNVSLTTPALGVPSPVPSVMIWIKLQEVLKTFTQLQELSCNVAGKAIEANEQARQALLLVAPRLRKLETSWDFIGAVINVSAIQSIPQLFIQSAAMEGQSFVVPGSLGDDSDLAVFATRSRYLEVQNLGTGLRRGSDSFHWFWSDNIWDTLSRRVTNLRISVSRWVKLVPFSTNFGENRIYERLHIVVIELTPGEALDTKGRPMIQAPHLQVLRLEAVLPTDPAVEWLVEIRRDELSAFTTVAFGVAVASRLQIELGPGVYFADNNLDSIDPGL